VQADHVPTLIEILKKTQAVSEIQLRTAREAQKTTGKKLIHILLEENMISEKDLIFTLSSVLGVPALNLLQFKIDTDVIQLVPRKISERYEVIPISRIGNNLTLAMADPLDMMAIDDVNKLTNCHIRTVIASARDIKTAIEAYYTREANLEDVLADLDPDSVEVVQTDKDGDVSEDASYAGDEAPVIQMVNLVLQEGIKSLASDIHFEPFVDRIRIRYRIDGALTQAFAPPRDMYNALMTRLKIVSNLDITEKRLPQDGRFKARFGEREIDFRVSLLPTYHGEKAVLRVLDKSSVKSGLDYLGYTKEMIDKFDHAIQKPYGMMLVTGPTGSGKSTTLYSILNQLNTRERNIMTVEDPIEYQIHGISQTQVNSDIGLTFADGLRSILRQSPDVILVGEIRDTETADIAVKAALTGHIVFSTLHTNNAAGAVTRLMDMGVEPFLIASSLIGSTAQRLVRRLCPNCKEKYEIPKDVFEKDPQLKEIMKEPMGYRGRGCSQCKDKGYRGRMGVMEILVIDEEIQHMIVERKSTNQIEEAARRKGMKSLFENALETFSRGLTSLEEVYRVSSFDD
jgi:type IV pilus assembly protein PilB